MLRILWKVHYQACVMCILKKVREADWWVHCNLTVGHRDEWGECRGQLSVTPVTLVWLWFSRTTWDKHAIDVCIYKRVLKYHLSCVIALLICALAGWGEVYIHWGLQEPVVCHHPYERSKQAHIDSDQGCHSRRLASSEERHWRWSGYSYCKTLTVCVPFISEFRVPNKTAKLKGANINCRPKIGRITTVFRIIWF